MILADALARLHAAVDDAAAPLATEHAARMQCARGCNQCCTDGLTVFEVEADRIRGAHPALLASGTPHPAGACAFLDTDGACRIYEVRPYVCRTQGLPLRWTDREAEYRDICPLNEPGPALTELSAESCWTLGPHEAALATLQQTSQGGSQDDLQRVALLALFARSR